MVKLMLKQFIELCSNCGFMAGHKGDWFSGSITRTENGWQGTEMSG